MLAIPVKSLGENPAISEYFGKSKWFAIVDEDIISFEKNTLKSGCAVADWLYDLGVTKTVINHIGLNPLLKLHKLDIECLYSDEKAASLVELFKKIESKKLNKINENNMDKIIDSIKGCDEICD